MLRTIVRSWNEMSTYRKVRRVISIGLIIFGLWALTPYLYNRQVNEAFPAAAPAMQQEAGAMAEAPTAMQQEAGAMTEAPTAMQQEAGAMAEAPTAMQQEAGAMAEAPTEMQQENGAMTEAPTAMAQEARPITLAMGNFVAGSFPGDRAEGMATIYRLEDGKQVLRLENFAATNGPDLFVTLHPGANPEQDQGEYFQLAALKGNQGNQNYELPAEIDLSKYQSVVIWCRTFNIVFGYATLQPAG